ncbi:MAG TPA: ABC-ATPase domain-containing protein, partial [Allocoleopsis sp.]
MSTAEALRQQLLKLDRQSYGAYKSIKGSYAFPEFTLIIDHVQGDPFAAPSRLRVIVPQKVVGFPSSLYATSSRVVALRDYLNRQFDRISTQIGEKRGSGKSGLIAMIHLGQQVLARS